MIDTRGQGNGNQSSNQSSEADYPMDEDCFEELLNDIEACHKQRCEPFIQAGVEEVKHDS